MTPPTPNANQIHFMYSFVILAAGDLGRGASIALTGMLIVAVALTLIYLFIASLPKALALLATVLPENEGHHHGSPSSSASHPESLIPDDEAVLAAIGYVLHLRSQSSSEK